MIEGDEEAHGEVVLAEGVGLCHWLDLHCYWHCHLYLHFFRVLATDVSEKPPESSFTGWFGVFA